MLNNIVILKKEPYRSFLTAYGNDKSCVELHFPIANTDKFNPSLGCYINNNLYNVKM